MFGTRARSCARVDDAKIVHSRNAQNPGITSSAEIFKMTRPYDDVERSRRCMFEMFPEQSPMVVLRQFISATRFLLSLFYFLSKMLPNIVNVRLAEKDWSLAIVVKERKTKSFDPGGGRGYSREFWIGVCREDS